MIFDDFLTNNPEIKTNDGDLTSRIKKEIEIRAAKLHVQNQNRSVLYEYMQHRYNIDVNPFQPADILLQNSIQFNSDTGKALPLTILQRIRQKTIGRYSHAMIADIEAPAFKSKNQDQEDEVYVGNLTRVFHCVSPTCEETNITIGTNYPLVYIDHNHVFRFRERHYTTESLSEVTLIRLKSNDCITKEQVDLYRYYVLVLAEYFFTKEIRYGGIAHILTHDCFLHDSNSVEEIVKRRWEKLLSSSSITNLVCSSLVLYLYQIVFYLFNPSLLGKCLNMDVKACKPDAIALLPVKYPEFWEIGTVNKIDFTSTDWIQSII